jgi:NADPH2:quinone reductase
MKAIVAARTGGPEVLELQQVPSPQPKADEVLVNVEACGLNFADLLTFAGQYSGGPKTPFTVGREFCGTVAATGERVMGYTEYGAFAEQVAAPAHRVWPAPGNFSAVQAAAFPVNFFTAFFAFWEAGLVDRTPDHELRFPGGRRPRVLIHAVAGGVGTAALQIAKVLNVETYGTASTDSKIQGAFELGLDHGIVYTRQDYVELIREHTNGEGVDAVFEMIGGDETARSIRTLAFLGRCILYGSASGNPPKFDARNLYPKMQSVWGLWLSRASANPDLMRMAHTHLIRWVAEGKLTPVIGHTLPFDQAAEAFRRLQQRETFGKVVLKLKDEK